MIRYLAQRMDVDLAFLTDSPVEPETRQVLEKMCRRVTWAQLHPRGRWLNAAWSLATGRSATEGLFRSRQLRRALAAWTRDTHYDTVLVFCSSMVQYLDERSKVRGVRERHAREGRVAYSLTPDTSHLTPRILVDLVDVDSQKWFDYAMHARGPKKYLLRLEARRLRRLEASLPDRVDAITLVSPQEKELYQSFCPSDRVYAIRNGVDLEYFHPEESVVSGQWSVGKEQEQEQEQRAESREQSTESRERRAESDSGNSPLATSNYQLATATPPLSPLTCLFVGALDYAANLDGVSWFCREVWPAVRREHRDVVFRLVGSRPGAEARRFGSLPGVELVGEVADVRPYLRDAAVVVVPLRVARGIQNKVLEGMAMGKAVIATPAALEGIGAVPGEHAWQAATADEWTQLLAQALSDPARCRSLGAAARRFVEERFCWTTRLEEFDSLPGLRERRTEDRCQGTGVRGQMSEAADR